MEYRWTEKLAALGACGDAVEWARDYETYADAWEACERADWLLWLAARTAGPRGSAPHRAVALGGALCAETALRYLPKGEDRPARAVDLAVRYGRGENVEARELRAAARAAYAAADAYAAYAAYAARAADAAAAYAAADAADAAAAAYAAYAAYAAAAYAAAAWAAENRRMANLVRSVVARPEL